MCDNNIFNKSETAQVYECFSLGAGVNVYSDEDVVDNTTTFNFKSLLPGAGISLTPSTDSITINSTSASVISKTVTYNYMQNTFVNLTTLYGVGGGTPSIDPYVGVTLLGTALNFNPRPRQNYPATVPFTLTNGTRNQQCSVTFVPNMPIDYFNLPILACNSDGTFWKVTNAAETLFLNYDGTTLTIPDVLCFAVDMEDNLMFYTTNAAPTAIRLYDFTNKIDRSMASGFTFNIRSMSYNNSMLYLMASNDGGIIQTIYITPFIRNTPSAYGAITVYSQPFISAGCTRDSILAHSNGVLYFGIDPSAGNSQVLQCLPFGSNVALASNVLAGAVSNYYLSEGPAGRVNVYSSSNKRFYNSRTMNTFSVGFLSSNNYIDIGSYPYIG